MDAPGVRAEDEAELEQSEAPAHWYCARCDTLLADAADAVTLPGRPAVEAHLNPHGIVYRVRTFRAAAVAVSGPLVPAFTWYPGYAWRLATCRGCTEHLGWAYLRIVGEGVPSFVGLIDGRITLR